MNMLKPTLLSLLLASGLAQAQTRDTARVLDARPISDRVYSTEEVCWERGRRHRDRGTGGAIAGALIGGLLGNQVGSGDGRKAATVAGAIAGAVAGRNLDRRDRDRYDCEQRQVYHDEVQYDVRYRYAGRTYFTRLPYDPGRRMDVWVTERRGRLIVEPVG
jgi:uncharacterized protein YcfJ